MSHIVISEYVTMDYDDVSTAVRKKVLGGVYVVMTEYEYKKRTGQLSRRWEKKHGEQAEGESAWIYRQISLANIARQRLGDIKGLVIVKSDPMLQEIVFLGNVSYLSFGSPSYALIKLGYYDKEECYHDLRFYVSELEKNIFYEQHHLRVRNGELYSGIRDLGGLISPSFAHVYGTNY